METRPASPTCTASCSFNNTISNILLNSGMYPLTIVLRPLQFEVYALATGHGALGPDKAERRSCGAGRSSKEGPAALIRIKVGLLATIRSPVFMKRRKVVQ